MGLDITAYGKLVFVETMTPDQWESAYTPELVYVYPSDVDQSNAFGENRCVGLIPGGMYRIMGKRHSFRAGSYSGYNLWREWLSITMLGVVPREVWNNSELYTGKPFVELINFSDCEGILAGPVTAKLAKDFNDHRDKACLDGGWNLKAYDDWALAFQLATDGGLVWLG